jgi:hypothetical protein
MDICINGEKADIILENEETIGDILAGLDSWLTSSTELHNMSNFRLSGLIIDGKITNTHSLADSFNLDICNVKTLDIIVSTLYELVYAALLETRAAIDTWSDLDFQDKQHFAENWKTVPAAVLILEQYSGLFDTIAKTFCGQGHNAEILISIIDERIRELENPQAELGNMEQLINTVIERLINLPLDIQTGKDRQASETIQIFTGITEKIFRIFNIQKATANTGEMAEFLSEFCANLKEMLAAYEQKDTVLVGDLAEYEMAPKLRSFYSALKIPAVA